MCIVSVDARLDVNVALNRPSYQVSTYNDGIGIYYSVYANDGSNGTDLLNGPCAHTNVETNPWWAVDLVVALYVAGVKFTNRDSSRTCSVSSLPVLCELTLLSVLNCRNTLYVNGDVYQYL